MNAHPLISSARVVAAVGIGAALMSGCMVGPRYAEPSIPTPVRYAGADVAAAQAPASRSPVSQR